MDNSIIIFCSSRRSRCGLHISHHPVTTTGRTKERLYLFCYYLSIVWIDGVVSSSSGASLVLLLRGWHGRQFIVTVGHCHMICDEYSVINQLANWNLLCSHLSWCKNILHLLLFLHLLLHPKAKELMPFGDHTKQYNHHRMKKMLFIPWVILGSCIRDTCKVMPFPASSCLL